MDFAAAVESLRVHAGLNPDRIDEGLSHQLWLAEEHSRVPDLVGPLSEIIQCISAANHECNGEVPSETVNRVNAAVVDQIGYAVSQLISVLLKCYRKWSDSERFSAQDHREVLDAAMRISLAWDMLLAGDHDDLPEDLKAEWNQGVCSATSI